MDIGLSSLAGMVRMGKSQKAPSPKAQAWIEARKRYHLSQQWERSAAAKKPARNAVATNARGEQ
jgi:hypothetical protein